ncbi:MAG: hypothetical protein WCV82_04365 [Candidatus Paceibacterota bacterium]
MDENGEDPIDDDPYHHYGSPQDPAYEMRYSYRSAWARYVDERDEKEHAHYGGKETLHRTSFGI